MKNAIIINRTVFQMKRMVYIGIGEGPCDRCDLKKKCEAVNTNPCDLFNTKSRQAYFKKTKVTL